VPPLLPSSPSLISGAGCDAFRPPIDVHVVVVVVVVVVVLPPKVPPDSPPWRMRPSPPRPAAAARLRGGVTLGVVLFDCCVFVGITEEATLGDDEYVRYHHGSECVKKLPRYPDATSQGAG
jgi:hypothetical protein